MKFTRVFCWLSCELEVAYVWEVNYTIQRATQQRLFTRQCLFIHFSPVERYILFQKFFELLQSYLAPFSLFPVYRWGRGNKGKVGGEDARFAKTYAYWQKENPYAD